MGAVAISVSSGIARGRASWREAFLMAAVRMGAKLGSRFTRRAEFVGGAVLIAIGTRILIEHLSGAA